jgi:hypothetical protein
MDPFTFTVPGKAWLNQQWGAQLLFAGAHRAGAWNAIALLYAGLTACVFAALFLACRRKGASTRAAALLTVAGFWMTRQNLAMRPQLVGVLLFAVCLWIVVGRRAAPRPLWALPAIMLLWVNVHGSFVLVPVLLGLAWIEDRKEDRASARRELLIGALSLIATVVNPFGLRVWGYAVGIGTNATITRSVTEWAPPSVREYSGAVFFASVLVVAGFLARRKEPTPWTQLLWLAVFCLIGLPALRGVVWWGLVSPVIVAGLMARPGTVEVRRGSPTVNSLLIASIVAVIVLLMPWWRGSSASGSPVFIDQAPQSLVDATERTLASGERLFVSQTYASWFEYALPSMPIFVDSRIELFPTSLWDAYQSVIGAREGWQSILDRWRVHAIVVDPQHDPQLVAHVRSDPDWRLAYRDDDGYLFVRS